MGGDADDPDVVPGTTAYRADDEGVTVVPADPPGAATHAPEAGEVVERHPADPADGRLAGDPVGLGSTSEEPDHGDGRSR